MQLTSSSRIRFERAQTLAVSSICLNHLKPSAERLLARAQNMTLNTDLKIKLTHGKRYNALKPGLTPQRTYEGIAENSGMQSNGRKNVGKKKNCENPKWKQMTD
jgi:hypothetical protein